MQCPTCGVEAVIMGSRYEVEGDQRPDTETKVFSVLEFQCRNPQCPRCKSRETVGTVRNLIYPMEPP